MAKRGLYYNLVESQQQDKTSSSSTDQVSESASHVSINVDVVKAPPVEDEDSSQSAQDEADLEPTGASVPPETDNQVQSSSVLLRLMKYNRPEWGYIFAGAFGSFLIGLCMPIYAVVYGEVVGILGEPDADQVRRKNVFYCFMFLIIAAATGVGAFLQSFMFAVAGENLTSRLRLLTFRSILNQEMAFFDTCENNVGALCSRLSSDASNVQGATGARIGILLQVLFSVTFSFGLSLYYDWKLALATSVFVPVDRKSVV